MKRVLLFLPALFLSFSAQAQCYKSLAGTYIEDGDSARPVTITTYSTDLVGDSGINISNSTYYYHVDCASRTIRGAGGDCSWSVTGYGEFTSDYNYITVTYYVYYLGDFNGQTWTNHYTRIPLLPEPVAKQDSVITVKPFTNPVTQFLNFTINDNNPSPTVDIRIFDLSGRCLIQSNATVQADQHVSIDVSRLMPAMYVLEVTEASHPLQTVKFIKQ